MRFSELTKKLKALGFWKAREGGKHEIWTDGVLEIPVGRHGGKEVATGTAVSILKLAKARTEVRNSETKR